MNMRALCTAALLLGCAPLCSSRGVNWYLNTGTAGNAAFLAAHADEISGAYLCCGILSLAANGSFSSPFNATGIAAEIAVFAPRAVETWLVGGIDEAAVHSGAWRAGLPALAAAGAGYLAAGLEGVLFDYEPSKNYSQAHAAAYAAFLGAAADALAPLRVGMDIAGWGILGPAFWPNYLQYRGISRYTSMTPTYDAANVSADEAFVGAALAALPPGAYAAGVGSVLAAGTKCKWDFLWNETSFPAFVNFMAAAGVEFIDVCVRAPPRHARDPTPLFAPANCPQPPPPFPLARAAGAATLIRATTRAARPTPRRRGSSRR